MVAVHGFKKPTCRLALSYATSDTSHEKETMCYSLVKCLANAHAYYVRTNVHARMYHMDKKMTSNLHYICLSKMSQTERIEILLSK